MRRAGCSLGIAGVSILVLMVGFAPGQGRGDLIAFSTNAGRTDPSSIYSLAPGRAPLRLTRGAVEYGLVASPVGDRVAFLRKTSRGDRVVVSRSDWGNQRVVTGVSPLAGDPSSLAFSPDGSTILVARSDGWGAFVDARTLAVRPLSGVRCSQADASSWSPDSRYYACAGSIVERETGRVHARARGGIWSHDGVLAGAATTGSATVFSDANGRRLATVRGLAIEWSPSERLLAVQRGATNSSCTVTIVVLDPLRPGSERVIRKGCDVWPSRFTPDGKFLVLGSFAYPVSGRGGPRAIKQCTWSVDGRCAFLVPTLYRYPPMVRVFVGNSFGGGRRFAGQVLYDERLAQTPVFANGGRTLLFQTGQVFVGNDLRMVRADGSRLHPVGRPLADQQQPAWSPDGRSLAYVAARGIGKQNQGASTTIWRVAADGSDRRQLTKAADFENEGHFDEGPIWSPDGKQVAFVSANFGSSGVSVIAAEGGPVTKLVEPRGDRSVWLVGWLPDSSGIVFEDERGIGRVTGDGSATAILLRGVHGARALSLDGTRVAIASLNSGISLRSLDGSSPSVKITDDGHASGPYFSPNGRELAFVDAANTLLIAPLDGSSTPRAIARCGCLGSNLSFSSDGNQIAYAGRTDQGDASAIFVVSLADGTTRRISPTGARSDWPAWQP